MFSCEWCNRNFNSGFKLGGHKSWCKKNPNIKKNKENRSIEKIGRKLTEAHKKNISKALKKAHKTGNHPGWAHINTSEFQMSRPEKTFKKVLQERGFYDKYYIKYGFPFGKYFLDFAILDFKLDIEIDGKQHFQSKKNLDHDYKRDKYILRNGWSVYRISVKELFENINGVITKMEQFIETDLKYRKYDVDEILEKYTNKPKYGKRSDYGAAIRKQNDIKAKPIIKQLLTSDIAFSKFGWVNKASEIVGITPQKISKWMERHIPDFYNEMCYKRSKQKILNSIKINNKLDEGDRL